MPAGQIAFTSLVALSVLSYLVSMIEDVVPGWQGAGVLLLGWVELVAIKDDPLVALAWFANPLLFAAWILTLYGKNRVAIGAAGGALTLSSLFLLGHSVLSSEAGGLFPVKQHGLAYDFWLASIAIAFVATVVRARLQDKAPSHRDRRLQNNAVARRHGRGTPR
jgi:hypothetical protein